MCNIKHLDSFVQKHTSRERTKHITNISSIKNITSGNPRWLPTSAEKKAGALHTKWTSHRYITRPRTDDHQSCHWYVWHLKNEWSVSNLDYNVLSPDSGKFLCYILTVCLKYGRKIGKENRMKGTSSSATEFHSDIRAKLDLELTKRVSARWRWFGKKNVQHDKNYYSSFQQWNKDLFEQNLNSSICRSELGMNCRYHTEFICCWSQAIGTLVIAEYKQLLNLKVLQKRQYISSVLSQFMYRKFNQSTPRSFSGASSKYNKTSKFPL